MKAILRKLHRWLGLSVGIWAALTALTGSLLVFDDEMDAWLNPRLLQVEQQSQPRDVDAAVQNVRAAYPDDPIGSLRLPREINEPLVFRIGTERIRQVYVDPYSTELLGERAEHGGVFGFLWDFHVHLLAGEAGETVAGYLALVLIGMLISGLVLWWPSRARLRRAFTINWQAAGIPRMYDLHRVVGAITTPLILIGVITGAMLVFHTITTNFLLTTLGGPPLAMPPAVSADAGTPRAPVSQWIGQADASLPGARPVSVRFPHDGRAAVVRQRFDHNPHPNGRSFVSVDPYSAGVVAVHDWRVAGTGVRVSDYKYPLHIGDAFGLPGRLLVLLIGLVPTGLLITGGYVWWRKRQRRNAPGRQVATRNMVTETVS